MAEFVRAGAPWASIVAILCLAQIAHSQVGSPVQLSGLVAYDDDDLFDSQLNGGGDAPFATLGASGGFATDEAYAPPPCRDAAPTYPGPPNPVPAFPSGSPAAPLGPFGALAPGQSVLTAQSLVSAAAATNVGYIDVAVPLTMFRARFDAAYGANFPDRAEFFYAQCGCLGGAGPGAVGAQTNNLVDYQEYRMYFENAFNSRFSVFADMGFRAIDPELVNGPPGFSPTGNTAGLADTQLGFKYALYHDERSYFTFQFQTYLPTGDADRGLGTNHVSLEPGFLYLRRLTDRTTLEAELKDWIPIQGTNGFEGNVLRYGVGVGHRIYDGCHVSVTPVAEFVGWSVLDGSQTDTTVAGGVADARTTIVNAKIGTRIGFGSRDNDLGASRNSLYIGYGRALTGSVWYEDVARLEYRFIY